MSTDPDFASMVKVEIVEEGLASSPQVQKGDTIEVHYTGKLDNASGKTFDSSLTGGRLPLKYKVGDEMVIKGMDEGLLGARIKEKRNLTIHSDWAYQGRGTGNGLIQPDATLYFECEIVSINGKKAGHFDLA